MQRIGETRHPVIASLVPHSFIAKHVSGDRRKKLGQPPKHPRTDEYRFDAKHLSPNGSFFGDFVVEQTAPFHL